MSSRQQSDLQALSGSNHVIEQDIKEELQTVEAREPGQMKDYLLSEGDLDSRAVVSSLSKEQRTKRCPQH